MDKIFNVDWNAIFALDTPILEIFVRGTVTYLALFALLRTVLKREAGTVGITDLLVVVLLADAIQNGMSGDYHSITDGVLLVATIIFWSYLLNWLGFHYPALQRLVHPPALLLVNQGKMLRRHMRRELITEEELMSAIRSQGVDTLEHVKAAYMESDGTISVITYQSTGAQEQTVREKIGQ
jgi:uncharacterized membrane protein YcaP (DUF421 family)